jgi:hypothetical protein
MADGSRFALDSPLEESGFEPSVPLAKLLVVRGPTAPPRDDKGEMLPDVSRWSRV